MTPHARHVAPKPATRGFAALLSGLIALGVAAIGGRAPAAPPPPDKIGSALDRGVNWLLARQNPDGGYGPSDWIEGSSDVGITSFVTYALARSPRAYKEHDGPYISKAVDFLLSKQQPSGAFFDSRDPSLQNYKTCVVILALTTLDPVKYSAPIKKASDFVKAQQASEAAGYVKERHTGYGGFGYGSDQGRQDLSNSQFAAEALRAAGVSGADELWVRLGVFLGRCQNLETVDPLLKEVRLDPRGDRVGTTRDGGFRYAPTFTRGNSESIDGGVFFSSYGSMTYAGLKSLLYAGVDRDDPRVKAAFEWISRNFTVKENPGMALPKDPLRGQQGLYYYYHTMAKCLAAYGEPVIVDAKGEKRVWARELGEQIATLQLPEGAWDNPADRWMEGIQELDTAYAVIALTLCQEELRKQAKPAAGPAAVKGAESKK